MENQDFTTSFSVAATPQQVFDALNNVRGWWSENIDGDTDRPGSTFTYRYQDVHSCTIKITEYVPGKKLTWHMQDNYFKFTEDKNELRGTDILFEISERAAETQLTFTHRGLMPLCSCYQICSDAWTHYINDSLKNLIATGKGKPTPKEEEGAADSPASPGATTGIHHRLLIKKPAEIVYEALTTQKGLSGWWTPDTIAEPKVGSISRFAFGPDYFKEIKVEILKPYSHVKWRCIKAFEDWIDTTMSFVLEPHAKGTILTFHHEGWKTYSNELASCSYDWALFFRSLKFLCEKGRGFPYPDFDQ